MLRIQQKNGNQISYLSQALLSLSIVIGIGLSVSVQAASTNKVFTARFDNDTVLERLYEAKEVSLTITESGENDKFLEKATVRGLASIDAVNGRLIVELNELVQAGMPMEVVGYVVGPDKEQGVDACSQWQTRMFEDSKLCYAAEVLEDREVQIVVSIDGYQGSPVVMQADSGQLDNAQIGIDQVGSAQVDTVVDDSIPVGADFPDSQ